MKGRAPTHTPPHPAPSKYVLLHFFCIFTKRGEALTSNRFPSPPSSYPPLPSPLFSSFLPPPLSSPRNRARIENFLLPGFYTKFIQKILRKPYRKYKKTQKILKKKKIKAPNLKKKKIANSKTSSFRFQ